MGDFGTSFDGSHHQSGPSAGLALHQQQLADGAMGRTPTFVEPMAATIGTQNSEIAALLRHIVEHSGSRRAEVLRSLRKLVKKGGGQLPDVDRMEFFETFYHMLADGRWKVACECTMLIVDIIPQMREYDLDQCMAIVLPRVVPNLGHESTDVRRASLRLLHVYMRYTNNLQKVLRMYVQYGLESSDKSAQKGCVLSLPLLFTEEFSCENLFPLVESLGELLVNSDTTLFYPVFLALQRLHSLVGNETFRHYLQHVSPEGVMLYHRVLSRNSTANSGQRSETGNGMFDEDLENNNNCISIDKLITRGEPPKPLENMDSNADPGPGLGPGPGPGPGSLSKSTSLSFDYGYVLEYGTFPVAVINRASSSKISEKMEGLNQMLGIIREAPINHISMLIPHLDDFLGNFISKLLDSSNFKVTLYGLDMIEAAVERLKLTAVTYMRPIIAISLKRLGDSRSVVREHNIRIFYKIMFNFPPQHVLDILFEQKYHRNPKVREEIVNRMTAAVLAFPRSEFNLPKMCYEVAPMLTDNKRMVRLAALECLAVLAQALGPHHLNPLVTAVDAVEASCECEGLLNAVQARLARRDLPRCHSDGIVRYVLNPSTFSGWFPSDADADIEWVMLASASNSGTPPKFPSVNPSSHIFHPRQSRGCIQRKSSFSIRVHPPALNLEENSESVTSSENEVKSTDISTMELGATAAPESFRVEDHRHAMRLEDSDSQRGISTSGSSSNGDSQSIGQNSETSSKGRELWRYYYQKFKQHLAGATCSSSATSVPDRSKTASYPIKERAIGPQENEGQGKNEETGPRQRPSSSSSASSDSNRNQSKRQKSDLSRGTKAEQSKLSSKFRQQRALSMPAISSMGPLSDISERSNEGSSRTLVLDQLGLWHKTFPSGSGSEPSTPERRPSMIIEVPVEPEKRRGSRASERASTPSPVTLRMEKSPLATRRSLSPKDGPDLERPQPERQTSARTRAKSISFPTVGADGLLGAPTEAGAATEAAAGGSRRSSVGSAPPTPKSPKTPTSPDPGSPTRRFSGRLSVSGSMPAIRLPSPEHEKPPTSEAPAAEHNEDINNKEDDVIQVKDVETQKDESDLSSTTGTSAGETKALIPTPTPAPRKVPQSKTPAMRRKQIPIRQRASRSISPQPRRPPPYHLIRIQPAIPANANIRNILENVAKTEGPFSQPEEALRAAIATFTQDAWTTKVEGMLAITRLASFHPTILLKELHTIVLALVYEVKNLRSSVSRSAIFTLGDLFGKAKKQIEPDIDMISQALLHKCGENVAFIRDDIDKAISNMIEEMPQTKSVLTLINNGAKNLYVRRTTAHYLCYLVEKMGATKCLMGPRDIAEHLLPAVAKFVQDGSPHTRFYGRKMFSILQTHPMFEKTLRKHVSPGTFRNICGILESIKRRGFGEKPPDLQSSKA